MWKINSFGKKAKQLVVAGAWLIACTHLAAQVQTPVENSLAAEVRAAALFEESLSYTLTYNAQSVDSALYGEQEVRHAILKGLQYWNECTEKDANVTLGHSNFQLVWSHALSNSEWGAVTYRKQRGSVIAFTIELNASKSLTLTQIEKIVAHEFGHVLGVPHDVSNSSVMHYNARAMLSHTLNREIDNANCREARAAL